MAVDRFAGFQLDDVVGAAAAQAHVHLAARGQVHVTGQHALAMHGLAHGHGAQRVQALRERPREAGRHVLRDQDRRAVRRQRLQDFADGLGAAGGSADDHELFRAGQRTAQHGRRRGLRRMRRRGAQLGARRGADLVGDEFRVFKQPVADAQLGFGHEVDRAQFQRAQRDFAATFGQRRHHHHRHGAKAHQLFQEIQPVHAGHFHVQRQHVRVVALDELAGDQRIGRGRDHFHIRLAVDDLGHQAAHQRGVIHTQNANFLHLVCCPGPVRPYLRIHRPSARADGNRG